MKNGVVIGLGIVIAVIIILIVGYFIMTSKPKIEINNTKQPTSLDHIITPIEISNFAFSPNTLTIGIGDTVTWTNKDSAVHTIVSDSGTEINSGSLANGASYSHTFTSAGTYDYHCSIHTSMKGKVIVS